MTFGRLVAAFCVILLSSVAEANPGDPLTTLAKIPIGINAEKQWFIGINQETVGTKTRFSVTAYTGPKWKKSRTKFKKYSVDTRDAETELQSRTNADKVRVIVDRQLAAKQVLEATVLTGGHTGRFRHFQTGLSVFSKKNQVIAHAGEISDLKQTTLIKNTAALIKGKCRKGLLTTKVQHVAFKPEWKAAAIYLELICTPPSESNKTRRSRLIIVRSLASIL